MTGRGARFFVYLNPLRILGFVICQEFWGEVVHPSHPGISGSTYAMKLNLTPGMALDKRIWLMTSSSMSRDLRILQTKNYFCWNQQKKADEVINQLLWSRRLPRISFNLIACLEPVKQDDHYFHAEILVCKFHLGSRKACLRIRRRFCRQIFLCKMFPRKFCSLGQSFMQNHQGVPELFKKNFHGVGCTPSKKKICEVLTRLWMHVVHLEFSSTLNSCSCTHGCFVSLIFYLI